MSRLKTDIWKIRGDLEFRWVADSGQNDSGGTDSDATDGYWVVKDPLARDWFCLTAVEKRLLELADGCRSIPDLCQAAIRSIAPQESDFDAMISFYAQARSKGLLVLVGNSGPIDQATTRSSTVDASANLGRRLGRLLAYRFPGFNPNLLTKVPRRTLQWATSWGMIAALAVMLVIAIATIVSRFDVFTTEVSLAFSRRDVHWWLLVLLTIGIAKSIHEIAHVAACRLVGAECREIGVMLLFGTPCLYCDVSDLWTVPSRAKRVFVSAAGMMAEVILAALATIVWAITFRSTIHDLALVVMVVCSVSTILVNANPLIRYDGYFMLADWIGVPNLSERATDALRRSARRIVWGDAEASFTATAVGRQLPVSVLLGYAILSSAYRVFIVAIISLVAYRAAVGIGFGWLGLGFAVAILGAMVIRAGAQVFASPRRYESASDRDSGHDSDRLSLLWWKHPRAIIVVGVLSVVIAAAMLIPIGNRVFVPVLIVSDGENDVHASEMGQLQHWTQSGTRVNPGDVLFQFANDKLQDQLRRADAEVAEAGAIAHAWQVRKGAKSGNSTSLAIAKKRLEAAEKNRRRAAKRVDRLTVRSHSAGQFIQRVPESDVAYERTYRVDKLIPAGTLLGWIGAPQDRAGYAVASQSQVNLIQAGQSVRLRHGSLKSGRVTGKVVQIDTAAWGSVPPEFQLASGPNTAAEPLYRVQIEFDKTISVNLPLRSVAIAEIAGTRRNVWQRLRRLFSTEFRGL